jgi:hypothetical protein
MAKIVKVVPAKDTRYLTRHPWYLADALLTIRQLQALVWPMGYHVALGGGVLNHGYSDKDLDLYVLPLGSVLAQNPDDVLEALNKHFERIGVSYEGDAESVQEFEKAHGVGSWDRNSYFAHSVCYFLDSGKKIDVFIVDPA